MILKDKIKIKLLKNKNNNFYFNVSIYDKYNYKQYVLRKNIIYTLFIVINFINKYGFLKK